MKNALLLAVRVLRLRLGRVEAGTHLRERMAGRRSARELYFHEERRWSELPEVYLRRALGAVRGRPAAVRPRLRKRCNRCSPLPALGNV